MIHRLILIIGIGLAATALRPASVHACASCKEAVANQSTRESDRLAEGYNFSILLMMAMPFGLVGAGSFFIVRAARRGGLPEL